MTHNFQLSLYKKFNIDLKNLNDEELLQHYENIGKYQMRIYYELSFFKKNKIYIFSTKFGYYMSNILRYLFFKNFIISYIVYDIDPLNPNLHIIPFSQKVKKFPKKYIIYQLEQKDISKWIDKKYELSILLSVETWDYSQSNINKFTDLIKQKMIYYPIPIIPYNYWDYKINNLDNIIPQNNILFYGSMNKIRETKLNFLQMKLHPKYKIKIINNIYGHELFKEILNSKIILNIHYYENAILETYRINEALSCKKIVISEKPDSIDSNNYNLYINKVIFIDNIEKMYEMIIYILEKNNDLSKILLNNKNELNLFFPEKSAINNIL